MTRRLAVDLGELELALQTDSYELRHYLDLDTGEIVLVMSEFASELERIYEEIYDEDGERAVSLEAYLEEEWAGYDWQKEMILLADQVQQGYHTRYIPVEKDDPHGDYRDMERFIQTLEDDELRQRLWRAIKGRGAFRMFKDVLYDYPEVRERWFDFRNARQRQRAESWLRSRDIEPVS